LSNEFLEDFFDENLETDSRVIIADCIDNFSIQEMSNSLARDTIRGFGNSNFIVFTEDEKSIIINSLHSLKLQRWKEETLKNATIISSDTIGKIFDDPQKDWEYFRKKYGGGFYSLSKPIFLRDNSLCVFYFGNNCGELCGEGKFSVYKKTFFGWSHYVTIYAWIS
jgi:hypothetical protein